MVAEMRPVLRRARLGDVHLRHDLDAHRHRRPVGLVQAPDLAQHAVDAVADAQEVLLRLEVDVEAARSTASASSAEIRRTTGCEYSSPR
jgi:hypothetical protein